MKISASQPVFIFQKNQFPTVAAIHHMVNRTFIFRASFATPYRPAPTAGSVQSKEPPPFSRRGNSSRRGKFARKFELKIIT